MPPPTAASSQASSGGPATLSAMRSPLPVLLARAFLAAPDLPHYPLGLRRAVGRRWRMRAVLAQFARDGWIRPHPGPGGQVGWILTEVGQCALRDELARHHNTDPLLVDALRQLGHRYGPLGVALTAAQLTDPGVLVQHLTGRVGPPREETPPREAGGPGW